MQVHPAIEPIIDDLVARLRDRWSTTAVWPQRYSGAYLGMGARDPVFSGPEHATLVIGPPRSGKTSSLVVPALTLWRGPAVVTSTKHDIVTLTSSHRHRTGRVWVWQPDATGELPEVCEPLRWSPLQGCADWDVALERAWMLTASARPNPVGDNVHWTERAGALLAPLLHAAAVHHKTLKELVSWVQRRDTLTALDLLSVHPPSATAHDLLAGIDMTDSRELSGIWSTADSVLAAYRTTATLDAAERPNFDPEAFAKSTDTAHLVVPATRADQHAPIVCALLDQIRHHLLARGSPSPPMLWALDELANIAPIPNLPSVVADGGAQGLVVLAAIQDLSQARHRWRAQAEGFLTLFTNTAILPGVADADTLKTVTTLAGRVDKPQYAITRKGILSAERTTSTRPTPLLPENVVAHGKPGHALLLRSTHPAWLRLTPWHATPWLVQQLRTGGEHDEPNRPGW